MAVVMAFKKVLFALEGQLALYFFAFVVRLQRKEKRFATFKLAILHLQCYPSWCVDCIDPLSL